jgi:hypothetical protein
MKNEGRKEITQHRISTGFAGSFQEYISMSKREHRHSQYNFADEVIYTEICGDLS